MKMTYKRKEIIGDCTLYLGDCLDVMPLLDKVSHIISDPPYESLLHDSKNSMARRRIRTDGRNELRSLDFSSIDSIRERFVEISENLCQGWFIVFCTIEGVSKWADFINPSTLKYKRACVWIKPDSTPQLNGQGPAQGCECFVCSWAGQGVAKWNGGGKRGVYTHLTNPPERDHRHPTEKPIKLFMELLSDFTNKNETILDPFMGSGTTGVACAKLGRKFIGIELDEGYFNIACERIKKAYDQPDLFIELPQVMKQEDLLLGDK
jgi:site-specific DNA-methyltransferase (adenine-specific)